MFVKIGPLLIKASLRFFVIDRAARGSIDHFIKHGDKIQAIRFYRAYIKNDFQTAKAYVEYRAGRLGLCQPTEQRKHRSPDGNPRSTP